MLDDYFTLDKKYSHFYIAIRHYIPGMRLFALTYGELTWLV